MGLVVSQWEMSKLPCVNADHIIFFTIASSFSHASGLACHFTFTMHIPQHSYLV